MSKYQKAVEILEQLVQENKIQGACLIINEGNETVLNEGFGWEDEAKTRRVNENTIYRLASMSKPVTAVAALTLVEQGKLRLTDSIADYLPEYQGTDKESVQIIHLMNHSCGIGMLFHPGMEQSLSMADVEHDKLADRVSRWKDLPMDFPAGTATGYSPNAGFEILGRVIEVITGMELDAYLDQAIFAPLGISDITFVLNEEQKCRRSVIYHDPEAVTAPMPGGHSFEDFFDAAYAGYYSGAAGLFGTARDYNRFVLMLANGGELDGARILQPETVELLASPSNDLLAKVGVRWGLGVQVFGTPQETGYYVHEGSYSWSGAYGTHFFIDPAVNRSFVLMLNSDNLGGSESYISRMIEKALFEAD